MKVRRHAVTVTLTEDVESRTLEVRASGKLTAEDYESFEPAVATLIKSVGKIRILFLMHDFHGWGAGTGAV